jgi:hypothetical protein
MLMLFWDFNEPILEHYPNCRQYCAMLEEVSIPTICSKHRGMLTKGVILHHDNSQPHMAAVTTETIQKLKFELLLPPGNSPDLSPSNYHIFRPLKDVFANDEEVKDTVPV